MKSGVFVISRVNRISSQHVRELISEQYRSGVRIYTDSSSDLIIKECLALGIYPLIVQFSAKDNFDVHVFVATTDKWDIEEIKVQYEASSSTCNIHMI